MAADYDYDVAISFLSRDEQLALELHARLSEQLSVFVHSKKQEELAGTDGLESFRAAFRSKARLVVVLYRDGWGGTPWTRIEQTAITERVLADGWDWLFFVVLDRAATLPKWLPNTHIRFNFEEFGLEQAIGAIKARVREIGGTLRQFDVVQQARLVERRAAFFAERERLFNSLEGVNAARQQLVILYDRIQSKIAEISASTNVRARVGRDNYNCVITNGRISVAILWRLRAANRLDNSPLVVGEYNSQILLPGEQGHYLREPPRLSEYRYQPDLSVDSGWCWVAASRPKEYLSSNEVGDRCVAVFLRLVDRVASGELEPPDLFDEDD